MQTIDLLRVALDQRKITRMKYLKEMEEVKKQTERIKQMNIAEVIEKAAQNNSSFLTDYQGCPIHHKAPVLISTLQQEELSTTILPSHLTFEAAEKRIKDYFQKQDLESALVCYEKAKKDGRLLPLSEANKSRSRSRSQRRIEQEKVTDLQKSLEEAYRKIMHDRKKVVIRYSLSKNVKTQFHVNRVNSLLISETEGHVQKLKSYLNASLLNKDKAKGSKVTNSEDATENEAKHALSELAKIFLDEGYRNTLQSQLRDTMALIKFGQQNNFFTQQDLEHFDYLGETLKPSALSVSRNTKTPPTGNGTPMDLASSARSVQQKEQLVKNRLDMKTAIQKRLESAANKFELHHKDERIIVDNQASNTSVVDSARGDKASARIEKSIRINTASQVGSRSNGEPASVRALRSLLRAGDRYNNSTTSYMNRQDENSVFDHNSRSREKPKPRERLPTNPRPHSFYSLLDPPNSSSRSPSINKARPTSLNTSRDKQLHLPGILTSKDTKPLTMPQVKPGPAYNLLLS